MEKKKGGLHAAMGTLILRNMMKGVFLRTHWKENTDIQSISAQRFLFQKLFF